MNVTAVLKLIEDERLCQVDKGFDATHDDAHSDRELLLLATGLIAFSPDVGTRDEIIEAMNSKETQDDWVAMSCWRMILKTYDDPIRRLVIACALIVAEIQRLQRAGRIKEAGQGSATNTAPGPDQ